MKIKITEEQAKRLKLINEDINPLTQFEGFCKVKIQEVDKLYLQITSLSIYEILHNQFSMSELNKKIELIEEEVGRGNRRAYQYIHNLPDEDLDIRIDRATEAVNDKLTALQLITMDLEKLQLSTEQHNIMAPFKDVKPMDISSSQS